MRSWFFALNKGVFVLNSGGLRFCAGFSDLDHEGPGQCGVIRNHLIKHGRKQNFTAWFVGFSEAWYNFKRFGGFGEMRCPVRVVHSLC